MPTKTTGFSRTSEQSVAVGKCSRKFDGSVRWRGAAESAIYILGIKATEGSVHGQTGKISRDPRDFGRGGAVRLFVSFDGGCRTCVFGGAG